jgi:hypothetical protein
MTIKEQKNPSKTLMPLRMTCHSRLNVESSARKCKEGRSAQRRRERTLTARTRQAGHGVNFPHSTFPLTSGRIFKHEQESLKRGNVAWPVQQGLPRTTW